MRATTTNETRPTAPASRRTGAGARPGERRMSGHSAIELGTMAVVITVMALLCANIGVLVMCASINDQACRDACRAAAQMGSASTAQQAAQAALRLYRVDGYFVGQPSFDSDSFVYQDFGGDPTPESSPFVTVTTTSVARIPAPILFLGARFGEGGTMTFSRTYTFPIVKTTINLS